MVEWHYNKLTSGSAEEYRESENAHVKKSHDQLCQNLIDAAQGYSQVYKHVPDADSPKTRVKEKSRTR